MSSFWREWIISYDASHQYILGQAALGETRTSWERARSWARDHYESMLAWARRSQKHIESSPRKWAVLGTIIAIVLLLVANAARVARMIRERRLRSHPERRPQEAAAMWYERMTRSLARWGMQRLPGNTPQEFVKKIEDPRLRARVAQFTLAYESARFGDSADDAQRLPELYEEVVSAPTGN
jgi:hypothetical protein